MIPRRRRLRVLGLWMLLCLPAGCAVTSTDDYPTACPHAYQLGWREAEQELARSEASLYVYGLRTGETHDAETGLPLMAIARCAVDATTAARAAGHNDRIMRERRKSR
jgi:hypothetical protein